MTLLEDIERAIASEADYYFDADDAADVTGSTVEESGIFLDHARWGNIMGTVFARYNGSVSGVFEYVMVSEYVYSGDSDGDMELTASVVYPHKVTTTSWESIP